MINDSNSDFGHAAMTQRALYYPYIHISDVDWLRGTLLLFNSVSRMLPPNYPSGPDDDPRLAGFQQADLLRRADIFSDRSYRAQDILVAKLHLSVQDRKFLEQYGQDATLARLTPEHPYGFQIHGDKASLRVRDELIDLGLAWKPGTLEPYDMEGDYYQMHPRVGQAIMATIAVACAQHEGLDIVGDARSGPLHQALLDKDIESIYDTWLGEGAMAAPLPTSPEEVFEFLIATVADVSELSPQALIDLDREPLTALLDAIRAAARQIPAMDPGPQREEYFADTTADIMAQWREGRKNLSRFWRTFFGGGASEDVTTFLKKGADGATKSIGGGVAGGIASHAMFASGIGGLEQGLFAATGSLMVGLSTRAITSVRRVRAERLHSPYRYLSQLQDVGVTFRSADTAPSPGPAIADRPRAKRY
jgi:hypothetical protein